MVEYLTQAQPSVAQRTALGAFLIDPLSKTSQEESFRGHFGLGFGLSLDGWRQWVMDQGIGSQEPPRDHVRSMLLERVLPAIRDPRFKFGDRIAAIHSWADAGCTFGADTLIHLLRDPGEIPKEEVIWALCTVSGKVWGDDPARWQAWWDDLPSECREPSEPVRRSSQRA
jgi:hypothetical protein